MGPDSAIIIHTVTIALAAGIGAQILADRLGLPSIVLLLVAGAVLGPDVLGWVEPESLGAGLEVLVGFSVAIILFEGALGIPWSELESDGRIVLQLVTVGALVTLFGGAALAWVLLPVELEIALLLGSLVIVTGPTVIGPLLKRVPILPRLSFILETEGVLIDPVGAIVAFVVLELVLATELALAPVGWLVVRLGVGAVVGLAVGGVLAIALKRRWIADPELMVLGVLAAAIGAFVGANALESESGLVAVVVAGFVVGNVQFAGKHELVRFKGRVTTLVLSLLFVLLSADIRWGILTDVGVGGFVWVGGLILLVRPASVFLSSVGTTLGRREKLFLSWISPRGIVAASVASLFAIYLERAGVVEADLVRALVFLTIAATVVLQGLSAGAWSEWLGVSASSYGVVIVGAGPIGRAVGRLLRDAGREVVLIDSNPAGCKRAQNQGLAAFEGNALETPNLERIGIRVADSLVALTPNPSVNELVARLAVDEFDVKRVLVLESEGVATVGEKSREARQIERAFAGPVREELENEIRWKQKLWSATVLAGADKPLSDLEWRGGVPLVRNVKGRAEVCGERTILTEGDVLVFQGQPEADWLEDVHPLEETSEPAAP